MKLNNKKFDKYFKKYSYNLDKVVGISPDGEDMYILDNGVISSISKKSIKQEYLLASYLPNKSVITYEFQIQKNLLDKIKHSLDEYVETKCYDDVGLDDAEEYIFKYKIIDSLEESKHVIVEVVIISKKDLISLYQPIIDKQKYLDFIAYPGHVYNVLYLEKILEPQNDLYIFFTKNDIIITLYSEGKFLQTSIIPEGLESIYDELITSVPIKNFTFDIFMQLIVKRGLDFNNYSDKEHILFNELSELFSNKFLMISNQMHAIIRKFSLTTVDRIFMGTPKGVIPGISEFANMYLGVEANDLKFDLNYNLNNVEIDQILFLSMLYAQSAYKNSYQADNFTIFYRPPTFFYRKSGQFISITLASILVSAAYPVYQMIDTYFIGLENKHLTHQKNNLNSTYNKLNSEKNKLQKVKNSKEKTKKSLIKYIKDREKIIDSIYIEKKSYVAKAKLIAEIVQYLYNNNVHLKSITYDEMTKSIVLSTYSNDNENITSFINSLVKHMHLIVTTPGYIKTNNNYEAKISIKVEQ